MSTFLPTMFRAEKFRPLLICSIGNPGPKYANTLHSAGHILLNQLQTARDFETFVSSKRLLSKDWGGGAVSVPRYWTFHPYKVKKYADDWATRRYSEGKNPMDLWTLWRSGSLMNVSGVGVRRAWETWREEMKGMGVEERWGEGLVVVLQDELEEKLGKLTVRKLESSSRGHRGIKSIQACLPKGTPVVRIGIGIGRPSSRDSGDVARYVLNPVSADVEKTLLRSEGDLTDKLLDIAHGHV
ncbi:peptidyl-tRNA hydrolase [Eremomyces bilateralis CBS 781.70]|uniref:Peptidyl-tRNA hydrolase n=1 Tax=Eremomyces bilateralis CBS 781.70 TaxID=1392243 RepID=A0A6G1G1K8_9PEZI|nr:peptidyl-tRNA hydrolase [Eremomyces bilateralis CBS 781.70]KAF1811995.1 peptidyl-tRNA hydrolase [Eremomyces bilateralis CBS 781.70]